jgi:hypothetical protein
MTGIKRFAVAELMVIRREVKETQEIIEGMWDEDDD